MLALEINLAICGFLAKIHGHLPWVTIDTHRRTSAHCSLVHRIALTSVVHWSYVSCGLVAATASLTIGTAVERRFRGCGDEDIPRGMFRTRLRLAHADVYGRKGFLANVKIQ